VEANWVFRKVVETKLSKLPVETTPATLETYPRVPKPTVVDVSWLPDTLAAAACIWLKRPREVDKSW
jgi:hypothetical protein